MENTAARMEKDIEMLSKISAPGPGVTRLPFTPEAKDGGSAEVAHGGSGHGGPSGCIGSGDWTPGGKTQGNNPDRLPTMTA